MFKCFVQEARLGRRVCDGRDCRAVRVVYEIWHGPAYEKHQLPVVFRCSEFGMKIHVSVAFLVAIVGLWMDKVTGLLQYFWQLELSKSQAEAVYPCFSQALNRWAHLLNLQVIVAEVIAWYATGKSPFDRLRNATGLGPPQPSRLKTLVPDFAKA